MFPSIPRNLNPDTRQVISVQTFLQKANSQTSKSLAISVKSKYAKIHIFALKLNSYL